MDRCILDSVKQYESPNFTHGVDPRYLVIHYTASVNFEGTISWLTNKKTFSRASAHFVISREGEIAQLVALENMAWHAGRSSWDELKGLNQYSIGIELINGGRLMKVGENWHVWSGQLIEDDQVILRPDGGWHAYTEKQMEALIDLAWELHNEFEFEDILGHSDISPGRKIDPGPAFNMASFKAAILGNQA